MRRAQKNSVLHSLRRVALRPHATDLSDSELLEGYLDGRDEAFFEAMLLRHGPMVLGVCRRVLHHEEDAHDAFQATFLVFLRKAATIIPRAMVGNWLYGVAHKTALKARAMNRQRQMKELASTATHSGSPHQTLQDRLELLDEALGRLPVKYRSAIVLCDLEGRTIKEAAQQQSCPPGTMATRLRTGRAMLAKRLARHGVCVAGARAAEELAAATPPSSLPSPLLASTLTAAATFAAGQPMTDVLSANVVQLTERVVKAMLLAKLKTLTIVFAVLAVLGGAVLSGYPMLNAEPDSPRAGRSQVAPQVGEKPKSDQELIQGTWIPVSVEQGGQMLPKERFENDKLIVTKDKIALNVLENGVAREGTYTIDPEKKPRHIDMTFGNVTMMGLYELKGKSLTIAISERGRPLGLDSMGSTLVVFERRK
jgi:RNA polymerase sigma-70 factor (ECF subfamily)